MKTITEIDAALREWGASPHLMPDRRYIGIDLAQPGEHEFAFVICKKLPDGRIQVNDIKHRAGDLNERER